MTERDLAARIAALRRAHIALDLRLAVFTGVMLGGVGVSFLRLIFG